MFPKRFRCLYYSLVDEGLGGDSWLASRWTLFLKVKACEWSKFSLVVITARRTVIRTQEPQNWREFPVCSEEKLL